MVLVVVGGKGVGGNWDRPKYSPSHRQQRGKTESNYLEMHNFPESSLNAKKAAIPLSVQEFNKWYESKIKKIEIKQSSYPPQKKILMCF